MIRTYQGHSPQIHPSCYIDPSAQILGDVVIGERSSVWMNAVVRGDVNSIRVGACSNVQDCAVLHGQRNLYPVIVGDWVTIGHNATVHGCVVGDMCVIGMGARVLNNAASARAASSRPVPSFPSTPLFLRARSGPAFPPSSAANSPTKIVPSYTSTRRIISTMSRSI